jgi:DNA-binding NarL/FixJ family response regulator
VIRVALVDDQEMIRTGLRTIVNAHPRLTVVAEAADGLAVLDLLDSVEVDVVVMDIRMPGIDGVEATRRIRARSSSERVRILVLTTFDQDDNVLRALQAGADGFFGKGAGPTEITDGILGLHDGDKALSRPAVTALVEHVADRTPVPGDPEVSARFERLTARELEVVRAIVTGLDNAEIAARFFVSPFTVKTHANRAMSKVGARDRAQLVSLAVRAGMRP